MGLGRDRTVCVSVVWDAGSRRENELGLRFLRGVQCVGHSHQPGRGVSSVLVLFTVVSCNSGWNLFGTVSMAGILWLRTCIRVNEG